MRNQYGIWNQQRWLRSMRTHIFDDKPAPAPLQRQPYYERMRQLAAGATEFYGGRRPQSEPTAKAEKKPKAKAQPSRGKQATALAHSNEMAPREGADIRWIKDIDPPERLFNKDSYSEWMAVVNSEEDFLSVIPKGDPYRLERSTKVYASGDLRYFGMKASEPILVNDADQRTWFMGADLGVRLRPTRYNQISAVAEARFQNAPNNEDPEDGFASGAIAKSAYLLIDDLAYNSFIQMGLYRPLFGHYDPDHNTLAAEISGLTQTATFKSYGIGTAPNVPYFIVNYIQPYRPAGTEYQASEGFSATAGARFVSYGASAQVSYWDTTWKAGSGLDNTRKMFAITGGAMLKNLIANVEFLRVERAISDGTKNAGNVTTAQLKYRTWREIYLVGNYAMSNVARNVGEGSGTETTLGLKSFLMSNFELETLYIMRKLDEQGVDNSYNLIQLQAHVFF